MDAKKFGLIVVLLASTTHAWSQALASESSTDNPDVTQNTNDVQQDQKDNSILAPSEDKENNKELERSSVASDESTDSSSDELSDTNPQEKFSEPLADENKQNSLSTPNTAISSDNTQDNPPATASSSSAASVAPSQAPAQEAESTPAAGITTLGLEGGNWFLKRQALEKTMGVLEEINTLFTKILSMRMPFLADRNSIDRAFDMFAEKSGFQLGDLTQAVESIIEQVEKDRKEQGEIPEDERDFLLQVQQKLSELKKMQTDLTSISAMDAAVDDVLMQVEEEINKSQKHQAQAWRNFQAIKNVLDDEKAEELYLKTDGLLTALKDIHDYLQGQLKTYFNKSIQTLRTTMQEASQKIESFKLADHDLKQTLATMSKEHALLKKTAEVKTLEKEIALTADDKKLDQPQPVASSFMGRITNAISSFFSYLFGPLISLFSRK